MDEKNPKNSPSYPKTIWGTYFKFSQDECRKKGIVFFVFACISLIKKVIFMEFFRF